MIASLETRKYIRHGKKIQVWKKEKEWELVFFLKIKVFEWSILLSKILTNSSNEYLHYWKCTKNLVYQPVTKTMVRKEKYRKTWAFSQKYIYIYRETCPLFNIVLTYYAFHAKRLSNLSPKLQSNDMVDIHDTSKV